MLHHLLCKRLYNLTHKSGHRVRLHVLRFVKIKNFASPVLQHPQHIRVFPAPVESYAFPRGACLWAAGQYALPFAYFDASVTCFFANSDAAVNAAVGTVAVASMVVVSLAAAAAFASAAAFATASIAAVAIVAAAVAGTAGVVTTVAAAAVAASATAAAAGASVRTIFPFPFTGAAAAITSTGVSYVAVASTIVIATAASVATAAAADVAVAVVARVFGSLPSSVSGCPVVAVVAVTSDC